MIQAFEDISIIRAFNAVKTRADYNDYRLIIAGAPVIVRALFAAFGNEGSTVEIGSFQ